MNHPLDPIARVCHEVNRAYCQALGDMSQPSWEDAPEWQRSSARMGVDLHSMGDFGPESSHISWMSQKLAEGWKYGPVKDPEAKEHPCIVAFADLQREQQAKDFIFRAVVHALRPTAPAPELIALTVKGEVS
jgi:RyR domain